MLDLAVIGAGPCGLAVSVAAKRAHLACSLFDKGPCVSSLLRCPLYMTFFSTPERLEIGVPFVTAGDKPTRREALAYYRRVAEHFELDVTGGDRLRRRGPRVARDQLEALRRPLDPHDFVILAHVQLEVLRHATVVRQGLASRRLVAGGDERAPDLEPFGRREERHVQGIA